MFTRSMNVIKVSAEILPSQTMLAELLPSIFSPSTTQNLSPEDDGFARFVSVRVVNSVPALTLCGPYDDRWCDGYTQPQRKPGLLNGSPERELGGGDFKAVIATKGRNSDEGGTLPLHIGIDCTDQMVRP